MKDFEEQKSRHTADELRQWQALPLEVKIGMTKTRIRQWVNEYGEDGVYVSFSGGKDSTVLSHIIDSMYPNNEIPRVFVNTGLEFPEIVEFVKRDPRAVLLRPQMNFKKVIEKYGYPFISKEVSQKIHEYRHAKSDIQKKRLQRFFDGERTDKNGEKSRFNLDKWKFALDAPFNITHQCCFVMKKNPAKHYEKKTDRKPFTAEMAQESALRKQVWLKHGCNMYDKKRPKSTPLAFWTEQDILQYIKKYNVKICSVYGDIVVKSDTVPEMQMSMFDCGMCDFVSENLCTTGMRRTGCMFCGFGCHQVDDKRFLIVKELHPKIYDWIMKPWEEGGLDYKRVIDWFNEHGNLHIKY